MPHPSHRIVITSAFETKSEEQANYIAELYDKLHSLIDCENSESKYTLEKFPERTPHAHPR